MASKDEPDNPGGRVAQPKTTTQNIEQNTMERSIENLPAENAFSLACNTELPELGTADSEFPPLPELALEEEFPFVDSHSPVAERFESYLLSSRVQPGEFGIPGSEAPDPLSEPMAVPFALRRPHRSSFPMIFTNVTDTGRFQISKVEDFIQDQGRSQDATESKLIGPSEPSDKTANHGPNTNIPLPQSSVPSSPGTDSKAISTCVSQMHISPVPKYWPRREAKLQIEAGDPVPDIFVASTQEKYEKSVTILKKVLNITENRKIDISTLSLENLRLGGKPLEAEKKDTSTTSYPSTSRGYVANLGDMLKMSYVKKKKNLKGISRTRSKVVESSSSSEDLPRNSRPITVERWYTLAYLDSPELIRTHRRMRSRRQRVPSDPEASGYPNWRDDDSSLSPRSESTAFGHRDVVVSSRPVAKLNLPQISLGEKIESYLYYVAKHNKKHKDGKN